MEPKTSRKIVTQGEYVAHLGVKATLSSLGIGTWLAGLVSAVVACILLLGVFLGVNVNAIGAVGLLIFGGSALVLLRFGRRAVKEAQDIDPGVPLTQVNAADLPASESLVRASSEPLQAQQNVLLRAATGEVQAEHGEQLLRAVAE